MKHLSIAVPCYNAQDYLHYCVESLLVGGEAVEILLINDGSKDRTGELIDTYQNLYPTIIKAIHQENKGHGGAVNTGISQATGTYFKVVDSDDWVDVRAYLQVLKTLDQFEKNGEETDVLITNFVYEKEGASRKKSMRYTKILPENCHFGWDQVQAFKKGQYMMMHSLIYRLAILKQSQLVLPEHTFYVDNLFVFVPLQLVEKLFYLNVDFYRYYIGRQDQSVNEEIMIKRIDQQIRVNKKLIQAFDMTKPLPKALRDYLLNHLEITTVISSALLNKAGTKEHQLKKADLWAYLKQENPLVYAAIRKRILSRVTLFPTRKVSNIVYSISKKFFGFN